MAQLASKFIGSFVSNHSPYYSIVKRSGESKKFGVFKRFVELLDATDKNLIRKISFHGIFYPKILLKYSTVLHLKSV